MRQANLPDENEEIGLKDLLDGEVVYTVPWAMFADRQGNLWLNGNYTFRDKPMGTLRMKVSKMRGEYIVDISHCQYHKWSRGEPGYVGGFVALPVAELLGAK